MYSYNEIWLKEGPFEERWNDGTLWFKGTYVNGNRHGLYEIYYSNIFRQISTLNYYSNLNIDSRYIYKQGKIKGFAEEYLNNGKLNVRTYVL